MRKLLFELHKQAGIRDSVTVRPWGPGIRGAPLQAGNRGPAVRASGRGCVQPDSCLETPSQCGPASDSLTPSRECPARSHWRPGTLDAVTPLVLPAGCHGDSLRLAGAGRPPAPPAGAPHHWHASDLLSVGPGVANLQCQWASGPAALATGSDGRWQCHGRPAGPPGPGH